MKSIGDWRRIGATLSGVVAIMSFVVLFAPDEFVSKTGLLAVRNENLAWVGLAFIVSISIFVASMIEAIWKWGKKKVEDRIVEKNLANTLNDLTFDQKELLRELMNGERSTIYRQIHDGTASYLSVMNVIVRTSTLSTHSGSFPFGLQPWARRALKKNPDLLS